MASRWQTLYEDAMKKVRAFERVRDDATSERLTQVALTIITRHDLTQEFVDELSKPRQRSE